MDIKYKNKTLEKQCTDLRKAKKNFGNFGEDVIQKITLIESMTSFKDILNYPSLHCHQLKGTLKNYWAIDVKGRKCSLRMIIAPLDEDGKIVIADDDFHNKCKSLSIILIEEVSDHYE